MAQLKYRKNDLIQLDFGLDIEGTSHQPEEVKLAIKHGQKHYAVVASKNDSKYQVEFDLDTIKDLKDDDKLDLSIEIIIKGRVFKPFKRQIEMIDYTEVSNQSAEETNHIIDTQIQDQEIKEEKKVEEQPKKTPLWAKDIFSGTDVPASIETDFSDTLKSILTGKEKTLKTEKVTIKFDKPKTPKKQELPKPIEIPSIADTLTFDTTKIKKKKLSKRKIEEAFTITEGQIKYI